MRCLINVQHNCIRHKCTVEGTQAVFQERERSHLTRSRVVHKEPSDLVLNTWQMRSAAELQPFRMPLPASNREESILTGARNEIDARKTATATKAGQGAVKGKRRLPLANRGTGSGALRAGPGTLSSQNSPHAAPGGSALRWQTPMVAGAGYLEAMQSVESFTDATGSL